MDRVKEKRTHSSVISWQFMLPQILLSKPKDLSYLLWITFWLYFLFINLSFSYELLSCKKFYKRVSSAIRIAFRKKTLHRGWPFKLNLFTIFPKKVVDCLYMVIINEETIFWWHFTPHCEMSRNHKAIQKTILK